MKNIIIKCLNHEDTHNSLIQHIVAIFNLESDEEKESHVDFFKRWFNDDLPGDKLTVLALSDDKVIGITRFWSTPYCDNIWLNEGLEVSLPERRSGIGSLIVLHGLKELKNRGLTHVFANIDNSNIPSVGLHEKIGFSKLSSGSLNSFGEFRQHIDRYEIVL